MKQAFIHSVLIFICGNCFSQSFVNSSFETWGNANFCEVNVPPDGWTDYSNGAGGIAMDEANFTLCATLIPNNAATGNKYARSSSRTTTAGEGIYQDIPGLIPGNTYTIAFEYAGSDLYQGLNDNQWHVFLDDIDMSQTPVFQSTASVWANHSFSFTATNAIHKIGFRAYTTTNTSTGSAAIDNIRFVNPEEIHEESDFTFLKIFPVPFKESLHVEVESNETFEFDLYDFALRNITEQSFIQSHLFNTEAIPAGIYFYILRSKDRVVRKGTIVK